MKIHLTIRGAAFSLVEVVVSLSIAVIVVAGIINGYVLSAKRAEWSAYSLAAESSGLQRLEQARACAFDPIGGTDLLQPTNFMVTNVVLDVPLSGTNNAVRATNVTSILTLTPNLKCIRVDTYWQFRAKVFSNSVVSYRCGAS